MKNDLFAGPFLFIAFFITPLSVPQHGHAEISPNGLKAACTTLSACPFDPAGLQVLLDYSRSTSSIPLLKSRAMAAFTLAALAKGDTNLFVRAQNSHAASFPQDRNLVSVRLESCFTPCQACLGKGHVGTTCVRCKGTRQCTVCGGDGKVLDKNLHGSRDVSMRCHECGGSGNCPDCKGTTVLQTTCAACSGRRLFYKVPATLMEDYRAILNEVLQHIEGEATLAEQIRSAMAEPVLEIRMRRLSQMLEKLRERPEKAELERQLFLDTQLLQTRQNEQQARALQHERVLKNLRELKTSKNPKASIVTLREFLTANPDSPDRIEVQGILNECAAKLEIQREQKKRVYAVGVLLIVLFGISCVHINYFKYTLLPSYTTAAQRKSSFAADQFTDPLSLTAKESKSRSKTKTSKIPLPEE